MAITLTGKYVLGIDSIDRQHARLVEIINRLSTSLSREDHPTTSGILRELALYAEGHFAYEEAYFVECNYQETAEHERGHRMFLSNLQDFRDQSLRMDKSLVAVELLGFLEDWLSHHILIADKQFADTFLQCGVR